jgi:hypothetical protein
MLNSGELYELFLKTLAMLKIWSEDVLNSWFLVFQLVIKELPFIKTQKECLDLATSLSNYDKK